MSVTVEAGTSGVVVAFLRTVNLVDEQLVDFSTEYNDRLSVVAGSSVTYSVDTSKSIYLYVLRTNSSGVDTTPILTLNVAKTDTELIKEYLPADAKAVGDKLSELETSLIVTSFSGGTELHNQPVNTICRISNNLNIIDAPTDINLTRYYWLFTVGGIITSNRVQYILYSPVNSNDAAVYFSFYNDVSGIWTQWLSTRSSADVVNNKLVSTFQERNASTFLWEIGKAVRDNGTIASGQGFALSVPISVVQGNMFTNLTPDTDYESQTVGVFLGVYKNGVFASRKQLLQGETYTVGTDVTEIRIMCGYASETSVVMTRTRLQKIFKAKLVGDNPVIPSNNEHPNYVAIGASTTVGAVHHFTGTDVTYCAYSYPEMIGRALGFNTYNLGQGTTGFMARDSGKKPNFMDCIYNNSDILSNTSLVTIVFGYGNDATAGLPIGEWDDYFPYDTEGYFFAEGDQSGNAAGITAMNSAGATLFGCLNWCVKWLGEHHPKAQVIVIFGSPSANEHRTVTITQNTGSDVSPQKIVCSQGTANMQTIATEFAIWRRNLNICTYDAFDEGMPFSYYQTMATNPDGTYAIFSTKGTQESPVWNSHPNEIGYEMYGRFLTGLVLSKFKK